MQLMLSVSFAGLDTVSWVLQYAKTIRLGNFRFESLAGLIPAPARPRHEPSASPHFINLQLVLAVFLSVEKLEIR